MVLKDENQEAFAAILDNLQLRVLGYQEDEETWVALALEMDIRGRGKSFAEAQEELEELIEMQIGFAIFKQMPELIFRPAEGDDVSKGALADIRRVFDLPADLY